MALKNLRITFGRQPKWLRITSYMIVAYLVYALILGVLTPLVLQSQLPQLLSDKLERVVSVEKIRINPFLLRVRVSNFVIEEDDSSEAFVKVSLLEVDAGFWQTITHLTPTIQHIAIIEPYTHLARTSGGENTRFNFSDIIDSLNKVTIQSTPVVEEDEDGEIPHLRLGRFHLIDGQILLSDLVTATTINYPKLTFELTELDTSAIITNLTQQQEPRVPENYYDFQLETAEGGSVEFSGQFQLAPFEVKGNIMLADIALAPLWPLSDDVIAAKLTNGLLDFYLDYHLSEEEQGIRFRAIDTQLSLSELIIADNEQARITVAGFHINGLNLDTDSEQIEVAEIIIDKPWVDASFTKDGLDLQTMLTSASAEQSTAQASSVQAQQTSSQPAESSWRVVLQSFALNSGDIQLNENAISEGMLWRVLDLNIATGVIDTNFEAPIDYTLDLGIAGDVTQNPQQASGSFSSNGQVNVNEQQVAGSFEVKQFSLTQLQSYVLPYLNITLEDGLAQITGTFDAGADSPITFNGDASIGNLAIIDGLEQQPLLKWQEMLLQGIQYQSAENQFSLQKVVFNKPYAKLVIDKDKQTNISDIMVDKTSTEESSDVAALETSDDTQKPTSTMAIRIEEVSINDGSAYFEDNSLRPRFASGIEALNGNITALSSKAETAANVDITGKIDGYAPVALKGEVNPLIEDIYLDLNFSINGAELTSVNPYSGTYMGHFIDKGLLSLDVNYRLENNQLAGDNHVIIDQLTLGRKTDSEQAVSLPLGLAIALLKDSNGVIDLGMEVSGDLNNPSFGFGSIIFKALGNIITKAVTAPFSLLANLVGSDDELNEVIFPAGSNQLNDDASKTLITLSEALIKRPGLRVNIEGSVNEVTDAYELAEQKLQAQLLELSGETSLADDFGPSTIPLTGPLTDALTTLFTTTTNKVGAQEREVVEEMLQEGDPEKVIPEEKLNQALLIAMYNQVRSAIDIPRRDLANLAAQRAKLVKTFLTNEGKVDPNRLFLLNSRERLQQNKSGVTLTLEAN